MERALAACQAAHLVGAEEGVDVVVAAPADQGHQAQAVRDELVVQHGRVLLDLDQVDGDGGDLGTQRQVCMT